MPSKSANVKNDKQYEALKDQGMSKQRAAKIASTPISQGGTTAQKKKAGSTNGKATAEKG